MKNLIHAELLKLRTTRVFWGYMVAALAFVPVSIALSITSATDAAPLTSSEGLRGVFSAASVGGLLLLLIGITMMAGEFRHNTATPTFLITPDRGHVIAAKLTAGGIVGLLVAAVASLLTLAVALPWLAARDVDVSLLSANVGVPVLGAFIATGLAAVVGVGLGALMPTGLSRSPSSSFGRRSSRRCSSASSRGRPLAPHRGRKRPRRNRYRQRGAAALLGRGAGSHRLSVAIAAAGTNLVTRKEIT